MQTEAAAFDKAACCLARRMLPLDMAVAPPTNSDPNPASAVVLDRHPVALAVRQVEAAAQALPNTGASDGALPAALDALLAVLPSGDSDALTGNGSHTVV